MSGISLAEIENTGDALEMAACRNQVRLWMTHDKSEILPEDQLEWYQGTYKTMNGLKDLFGYVLRDDEGEPIGYGLISKRDGKYWLSGGVIADARGQGAGRFLFERMLEYVHEDLHEVEVWLDVAADNERAQGLYHSLGFTALDDTVDPIVMVHRMESEG